MEKLSFFGVGPKIARITLPWLALTIVMTLIKKELFVFTVANVLLVRDIGYAILGTGLLLYFVTVRKLLKGLKETKLVTTGGFYLCQNPLYASLILMIIPGIAVISNSWLILTTSVIGFIMFKVHIGSEYKELERIFGESYLKYKRETPEFFPFPVKKLFG
jgi:protein-S-isoprenylcysteine O-methyltransferase Ste14